MVATGGGVVLNKDKVAHMKKSGIVIWLMANPETVKNRILQDEKTKQSRPSLTSKGVIDEIEETMEIRKPYYQEAMDFYIDTNNIEVKEIADRIISKML